MKQLIPLSLAVILIILPACQKKQVDKAAEGTALMQVSREWSQAIPTKDHEKILSYWAEDAVLISPNEGPLKGKAAIRAMVEAGMKDPAFSISWEPLEAHISDDGSMGYLIEQSKVTVSDSLTLYQNTVTVWQKTEDGIWKNVVDISTPDAAKK